MAGTVPTLVTLSNDHQRIFAVGRDGSVWTSAWDSSFDWGTWEMVGADGAQNTGLVDPGRRQRVAAAASADGRVDVFAIDRKGHVIASSIASGRRWDAWAPVGAEAVFASGAQVTALALDGGALAIFAPASDGGVLANVRAPGGSFGPWARVGATGLLAAPPRAGITAVPLASGKVALFVAGRDGLVHESVGTPGGAWDPWAVVPGLGPVPAQAAISAAVCRDGRLDLFAIRADGVVHGATCRGAEVTLPAAVKNAVRRGAPPPPPQPYAVTPPPPAPAPPDAPRGAGLDALQGAEEARAETSAVGRRLALLVGVNHYVDKGLKSLNFCVNDANGLRDTLLRSGYDAVTVLADDAADERLRPTRENIKVELMSLVESLLPDDMVLVHFSCHGTLVGGRAALLPSNTRMKIVNECVLLVDEVTRILGSGAARRIVVLLDACHTGADLGRDTLGGGLTPDFVHNVYELAVGMKVLAGATSQEVACERDEAQHGAFTSFVIEALERVDGWARADRQHKGFVTFDDLRDYVTNGVMAWSKDQRMALQLPNDGGPGAGSMMVVDYRQQKT